MHPIAIPFFVIAALLAVASLFAGLIAMAQDGEDKRRRSNKLMRARVIMQGVSLIVLAIGFAAGSG